MTGFPYDLLLWDLLRFFFLVNWSGFGTDEFAIGQSCKDGERAASLRFLVVADCCRLLLFAGTMLRLAAAFFGQWMLHLVVLLQWWRQLVG